IIWQPAESKRDAYDPSWIRLRQQSRGHGAVTLPNQHACFSKDWRTIFKVMRVGGDHGNSSGRQQLQAPSVSLFALLHSPLEGPGQERQQLSSLRLAVHDVAQ
ncbi:MAG: hypothetical protein ACREBC_17585, partial [Pyrinomonadaceae bacterium]